VRRGPSAGPPGASIRPEPRFWDRMSPVYENVIVPFDGSPQGRGALAPAADLAWRCGARIVIVNNTDASDKASRAELKTRAMSLSGADVDFWVDLEHSLGRALVEAARFRPDPIV